MNPVYIRMMVYTLAGIAAALGIGDFDPDKGIVTLDLNDLIAVASAALGVNGAVFAIWGKK